MQLLRVNEVQIKMRLWGGIFNTFISDVIMNAMASQITIVSIVYSGADQRNIKAPRHWPLWGEFTGPRWIPRTKGQWRGKCFHLMTSSSFLRFSHSTCTEVREKMPAFRVLWARDTYGKIRYWGVIIERCSLERFVISHIIIGRTLPCNRLESLGIIMLSAMSAWHFGSIID